MTTDPNSIVIAMELHWTVWSTRLAATVLFCGLIGFEREVGERPAGLRTHILIGLASSLYCLVMLHMIYSAEFEDDQVRTDPIRVVEAVTQGVAFLAAGLVVFAQGNVRGLKTGATMWLAAAIGVTCALGLLQIAASVTAVALVVLVILRKLEQEAGTHVEGHAEREKE